MATILVAGGTGDLSGRIIKALLSRGADVRAVVRTGADRAKVVHLEQSGVKVTEVNMLDAGEVTRACMGVSCIVSALQGLHDVIVDIQSVLLDAAVAAGVPRFIPSDYSSDFTRLAVGDNRNFDLRREFHGRLDKAPVKATSILNGAFAELLAYNIPFFDSRKKTISYWESADWHVDFTTMDNTAAFTAAAALDPGAPEVLHIAGFQVSANELATIAGEALNEKFTLVRMGSRDELAAYNKRERAAHPEGEHEIYSNWQRSQYVHSMFTAQLSPLDNDRYPEIKWTGVREVIGKR